MILPLMFWFAVLAALSTHTEQIYIGQRHECSGVASATTEEIMSHAVQSKRSLNGFGFNFTAFTARDTLGIPPDMDMNVGPTQVIAIMNGWIRSFNSSTGRADNIMNIDLSQFFAPIAGTEDPFDVRIRYDRFSTRWFLTAENNGPSNQLYIAVSDGPNISRYTRWTFFKFTIGDPNNFADYPTLGIDVNALYVGTSWFEEPSGEAGNPHAYVIPKAPLLGVGTPVIFTFDLPPDLSGNQPLAVVQGATNFDATATIGYFVSTNVTGEGLLVYRVTNPTTTHSLFGPFLVTSGVPEYQEPIQVPTLDGRLIDGGDSRAMSAHIRNNQLWTAVGVGVDNNGTNVGAVSRDGCLFFQLDIIPTTPTVIQSGILYTQSANNTPDQRSYTYPSVMTSGQNNMAMGTTAAGSMEYINCAVACRAATDPLGTLRPAVLYTSSNAAYNYPLVNRWGDYSNVSVDPNNDMTLWTIQEFCLASPETWACQIVQIIAPPPAMPVSATSVASGQSSVNTTVTGTSINGSGFFDPGVGFPSHISATVTGGIIVNSVTYIDPTHVILNVNTTSALPGTYDVTITNPDGQSLTGVGILTVT